MAERAPNQGEQVAMAQVLLSMRSGDPNVTTEVLWTARNILGAPIAAAAAWVTGYRRAYEAVLNLHLMHELESIHNAITGFRWMSLMPSFMIHWLRKWKMEISKWIPFPSILIQEATDNADLVSPFEHELYWAMLQAKCIPAAGHLGIR
jgi:hypothetical protein